MCERYVAFCLHHEVFHFEHGLLAGHGAHFHARLPVLAIGILPPELQGKNGIEGQYVIGIERYHGVHILTAYCRLPPFIQLLDCGLRGCAFQIGTHADLLAGGMKLPLWEENAMLR